MILLLLFSPKIVTEFRFEKEYVCEAAGAGTQSMGREPLGAESGREPLVFDMNIKCREHLRNGAYPV